MTILFSMRVSEIPPFTVYNRHMTQALISARRNIRKLNSIIVTLPKSAKDSVCHTVYSPGETKALHRKEVHSAATTGGQAVLGVPSVVIGLSPVNNEYQLKFLINSISGEMVYRAVLPTLFQNKSS